jgi:hypothetical protein
MTPPLVLLNPIQRNMHAHIQQLHHIINIILKERMVDDDRVLIYEEKSFQCQHERTFHKTFSGKELW